MGSFQVISSAHTIGINEYFTYIYDSSGNDCETQERSDGIPIPPKFVKLGLSLEDLRNLGFLSFRIYLIIT